MKAYGGSEGMAPVILKLCPRRRPVVSSMAQLKTGSYQCSQELCHMSVVTLLLINNLEGLEAPVSTVTMKT